MLKSKRNHLMFFIVGLFWLQFNALSQHHISKYEKRWALWHPFSAVKIKKHLPEAMAIYKEVKTSKQLDTLESGGKLDAFRHSYSMAYLCRYVKVEKLRKLGKLHEKGNKFQFKKNQTEDNERPDSLACEMDLRNNQMGFLVGTKYKLSSVEVLKEQIVLNIKNGNAWILKKNAQNQYISCDNELILVNNYKNTWFLPKCLIRSNE